MSTDPVTVRVDYPSTPLERDELAADPVEQLRRWLADAAANEQVLEPGMVLCTVDPEGRPAARTVLLRGITDGGLVFFTSYRSRKAEHMAANDRVALHFRWSHPTRQIEIQGRVAKASAEASDAYFASRPRGAQIGAHASPQSSVIPDRTVLDTAVASLEARFPADHPVPRPDDWGGYVVTPERFEFWQGRPNRLHDRFVYRRGDEAGEGWVVERLAP